MIKSNYEVEILVNGKPVKEYFKDGKTYVESKNGTRFTIKVKNNGYRRILAVPSVDGLSVMNGQVASLKSGGYIVGPYSSVTIEGWRTSDQNVSEFFFTSAGGSYAARVDKPGNVGVIGVAVFREKDILASFAWKSVQNCGSMYTMSCSTGSGNRLPTRSMSAQESGTGFGQSRQSEVVSVDFNEEDAPDAVFEIFYNSRRQLERLGIDFREKVYVSPQAFPGRYCEPPRN